MCMLFPECRILFPERKKYCNNAIQGVIGFVQGINFYLCFRCIILA